MKKSPYIDQFIEAMKNQVELPPHLTFSPVDLSEIQQVFSNNQQVLGFVFDPQVEQC